MFTGLGVTDGGNGVNATFDPVVAGEGVHTVTYTQIDPTLVCPPVIAVATVTVNAAGDPTFMIPNEVCLGDVVAAGGIDLILAAVNASLDLDDEVVWSGGLTGDVVDNGITGVFTPSQAGTFTICVETGDADCAQTHCEDIIVHDNVVATIDDLAFDCTIAPSGNISLSSLFTANTTPGGTFTLVGSTGTGASGGVSGGTTLQYNGPGCYEVSYTVTTLAGSVNCTATDNAFIVIPEQPQPSFDMAEEQCWDGEVAVSQETVTVTRNSPTYDAGTPTFNWTTSNAAVLDFAAGSAATDAEPTYNLSLIHI